MTEGKADVVKVKLGGEAGDNRVNRPHELNDEVWIVEKAVISKVAHSHDGKGRLIREETTEPIEAYLLEGEHGLDIADLLQGARAKREKELDVMLGRQSLFGNGEDDHPDDDLPL